MFVHAWQWESCSVGGDACSGIVIIEVVLRTISSVSEQVC